MKHLYSFVIVCFILFIRMMAQNYSPTYTKDWLAEEGSLHYGCSYVRSSQGTKKAVLYYSIKEKGKVEGTKYSKMFIDVVELSEMKSGLHEMLFIDEEYPYAQTCTDILLIREESGKVFCQSEDGTKEWLIFDFSLNTGDIFENPIGEQFVVKETGQADNHKKLLLVSGDGSQEDSWIEGIGSLQYGFLPNYVAKTLKYFQGMEEPLYMYLWAAGAPLYFVSQNVNDEFFIIHSFDDEPVEDMTFEDLRQMETWLTFSFESDSLRIQGYYPLELYPSFVAARIEGTYIDISIHQVAALDVSMGRHVARIDVCVPDFHKGAYEVGLLGKEHVTLECKGKTATYVNDIISSSHKNSSLFDLQGRKLDKITHPSIYIKDGNKVLIR